MKLSLTNPLLLLVLATTLLMGCVPAPVSEPITSSTITAEITITPEETPTSTPTPTPTLLPLDGQQTQYIINAIISYYNRDISVTSRSIYTNRTNTPIKEMVFIVYPTIFSGSFSLNSVSLNNGSPVENYYWESLRMVIPLETPLLPGEQIDVVHDFELRMPDREGTFGQSATQLNLSYWFPQIPPFDETNGWRTNEIQRVNLSFVGEFLVFDSADFDVSLQFTEPNENFSVAAGAIPEEKDGSSRYQLNLARTFSLSISDSFIVAERELNGIKIRSYTFPQNRSEGELVAEIAMDSIALFSEYFYPYERSLLSIVEGNFPLGMEFDGIIFLSPLFFTYYPGTTKSNLHLYTAHEIAHQWFYSLVGNDPANEPWLDEALATYSEVLFLERYYPDLIPWWWENYVDFHNPSGYIDISIYFGGDDVEYRNIVYRNGARFLQDLRDNIGDEHFFSFLGAYVKEHRYAIANADGFWSILKQHTDADLNDLLEQYFSNPPDFP